MNMCKWILHQFDEKHDKYFYANSYDDIIKYMESFDNLKQLSEFIYKSNDIMFKIHIGEVLEYGEEE